MKRLSILIASLTLLAALPSQGWVTDYEKAQASAKASGKYVLLYFTGSDWCGYCLKLKKNVLQTGTFTQYAGANLVCVTVDFPRRKRLSKELKKQNRALDKKYNIEKFPTLVILGPDGDLAGRMGYRRDAKEFVQHLAAIVNTHKKKKKESAVSRKN